MVRLFIGIMAPENFKNKIISIQNYLKELPIACKMVERENLHISLSFLGELDDDKITDICEKMDKICQIYHSFDVIVSGTIFIPNENYIKVLSIGCSSDLFETLGKDIKNEIGGDAKQPHLTLCRVRNIEDRQKTIGAIKKIDSNIGIFTVSSIQLIKSELQKTGPLYSIIHESKLL